LNPDFLPTARPISRLIEEFNKLPGIGPKTAQRLAYHLLQAPVERSRDLADAVLGIKENLRLCSICLNITDTDPCGICADETRDITMVCVVEEPIDIMPLERTRKFRGLYHVLHGVISPSDGVKPEDTTGSCWRDLAGRALPRSFWPLIPTLRGRPPPCISSA
jgi:recombination protein RecR